MILILEEGTISVVGNGNEGKTIQGDKTMYKNTCRTIFLLFVLCSRCIWLQSPGKCLETFAYSNSNFGISCVKCSHANLNGSVELQPASPLLLLLSLP